MSHSCLLRKSKVFCDSLFFYICSRIHPIMKTIITYFLLMLSLVLPLGCDMIEYHPYATRVTGDTDLTRRMIERIETECAGKDTLRFAVISDTQRWYDETKLLVNAINARGDVDFVIHLGDQSDFGLTEEFKWQRKLLMGFQMPYVCIIGNHDCLGTGEDVYHKMYGDDNFSFNASFLHVLCLNTNAFEYDYSQAIPDFSFIKDDLAAVPDSVMRTVVAMHAIPYTEQFNNNVADYFDYMLNQFPQLLFCMGGHDHHVGIDYPYENGVPYYKSGSAKSLAYLLFTITRSTYRYEAFDL
mgnify:FL=1